MKVLSLRCGREHLFEGWFASDDEFKRQCESAELVCPVCADTAIARLPSAPRLNVSRPRSERRGPDTDEPNSSDRRRTARCGDAAAAARAQAEWLHAAREAIRRIEDVGDRFAEEARRMHYGEVEERGIRGRASAAEAESLREEGIGIFSLRLPDVLKEPLQ